MLIFFHLFSITNIDVLLHCSDVLYDDEEVKLSTWLYAISGFIQAYQWEHSGKR